MYILIKLLYLSFCYICRKAGYFGSDGVAKVTTGWELTVDGKAVRISFCEYNMHRYLQGCLTTTTHTLPVLRLAEKQ